VLWPEPAVLHPGVLEVTALDVGQGDSLLAVNPERGTMLIDAGGPVGGHGMAETIASFDVGEQVVSPYLWSRRLRRVDVVVLTHAHTDHMGGMAAVLENFRPRELWTGVDPRSPLYAALLAEAARLGVVVRHLHAGDHVQWGSVAFSALAPAVGYGNAGVPRNDDSLVLRMQLGKASVLLEGDAERPSEDAMLAAGLAGPVTLLKVGHHGSKTSTNPEFAAAVQARTAVVSVGKGNTFGHPRADVIERLAAAGTHLFRTDEFGLTTFLLAPDGTMRAFAGSGEVGPAPNAGK
jgi:competence protein ComEC